MPWTLNPLLGAGSGGTLFQLLFVIVMIIGWVIKTIAESRGRTPQSRRTPPRTREPSAPGPLC